MKFDILTIIFIIVNDTESPNCPNSYFPHCSGGDRVPLLMTNEDIYKLEHTNNSGAVSPIVQRSNESPTIYAYLFCIMNNNKSIIAESAQRFTMLTYTSTTTIYGYDSLFILYLAYVEGTLWRCSTILKIILDKESSRVRRGLPSSRPLK